MVEFFDLPHIWAALIAFAVLAYVVLDGFDLGIGLLFLTGESEEERDQMMNAVAPVWDGNETWLILGGGGLFAAFPLAYSVVMPALYVPIIAMLLGLIFRGVAFEARFRADGHRWLWDLAFFGGSVVATVAQGMTLGALVQGIPVTGRAFAGTSWDWLSGFSIVCGFALLVGYALLGACWLVYKTEGPVAERSRGQAKLLLLGLLGLIGVVSAWTPLLEPGYRDRWFAWPSAIFSFIVPVIVIGAATVVWRGLGRGYPHLSFAAGQVIFACCFAGIGVSFYPHIVPPSLTIEAAAAPPASQEFILVGAAVLIPIILLYTGYAYWVFRGKVKPGEGYHQ